MAESAQRSKRWKWWVCGLLLLATMINYMDRQTLANVALRIQFEFDLNDIHYGNIEMVFGYAFAAGLLIFGFIADRVSVMWLYPVVLTGWSLAGFATGLADNYEHFLICRIALGLFEAAAIGPAR